MDSRPDVDLNAGERGKSRGGTRGGKPNLVLSTKNNRI